MKKDTPFEKRVEPKRDLASLPGNISTDLILNIERHTFREARGAEERLGDLVLADVDEITPDPVDVARDRVRVFEHGIR